MNSGIKKMLNRMLPIDAKLLLHRIVKSNLISIDVTEVTQCIYNNTKFIDRYNVMKITCGNTVTTMFDPPIHSNSPMEDIDSILSFKIDNRIDYRRSSTKILMIEEIDNERYVMVTPNNTVYRRVNDSLFPWYKSISGRTRINHYIKIEGIDVHVGECPSLVIATIPEYHVSYRMDTMIFNCSYPHPLLKMAIEIVLASRDSNISY